jgi:hypothetical protein
MIEISCDEMRLYPRLVSGTGLRFEIDAAPEPGIQFHSQLCHLVFDRAHTVFQSRNLLFDLATGRGQHLLRLFEGDVKKGIANLVPGDYRLSRPNVGGFGSVFYSRHKFVFVCQF